MKESTGRNKRKMNKINVIADLVQIQDFPRPLYVCRTHVTQAQWISIMGSNPSHFKGLMRPVESVSWGEVQYFLGSVNGRPEVAETLASLGLSGCRVRLLREHEWGHCIDMTEINGYNEWRAHNSGSCTHDVATREPNSFGLYDMGGNVCEHVVTAWCREGQAIIGASHLCPADKRQVWIANYDYLERRSSRVGIRLCVGGNND